MGITSGGERRYMRNFESLGDPSENPQNTLSRIGERSVEHVVDGTTFRHTMNPNEFRCGILASQLMDEWQFRFRQAAPTRFGGQQYRQAIRSFVDYVDGSTVPAGDIRLDRNAEAFLFAFYDWERYRAENLPENSELASRQSAQLLGLIRQRASRGLPVCDEIRQRCASGASFPRPTSEHLEEFSRTELQQFIQQARKSIRADQQRLRTYRKLASQIEEDTTRLEELSRLLHLTVANTITTDALRSKIPMEIHHHASELGVNVQNAGSRTSRNAINVLHRLIYASERELIPPILLLIYKTGLTYAEIQSMRLSSMTDEGSELTIRAVKQRANTEAVHRFPVTPQDRQSPWSIFGLFEYITWLTQPAREEAPTAQKDLLLMTHYVSNGRRYVKHATHRKYRLSDWMQDNQIAYSKPAHWNRLRKSHHSVRALNSSDPRVARSTHSSEVFERHYLSTQTVLQKSGKSYLDSAKRAFQEATHGPQVKPAWSISQELEFSEPQHKRAWEAARSETSSDRAITVGKCSDMEDSPFSRRGPCSDQVRFCIICPNALILKDHLPQVVILRDHLEKIRKLSDPSRFHAYYWRITSSLEDVLGQFSKEDIAMAYDSIESGREFLCIPVSMRVAF